MADTFQRISACFHGHAVEDQIYCGPADGFYPNAVPRGKLLQLALSLFRDQSLDRIQVEAPFYARGPAGLEKSLPPTAADAAVAPVPLGETDRSVSARPPALGPQKAAEVLSENLRA